MSWQTERQKEARGEITVEGALIPDGWISPKATLDDTGVFGDVIQLFIGNSLWSTLMLQALGIGTTIVVDKPFTPELNLGYQFSLLPCIRRFKLTNGGHHFHRLFRKVECNSPAEEEGQSTSAPSSPEAKDDSQSPKRTRPVFGLEPPSMDLQPGESVDMVLRGFSRVPQVHPSLEHSREGTTMGLTQNLLLGWAGLSWTGVRAGKVGRAGKKLGKTGKFPGDKTHPRQLSCVTLQGQDTFQQVDISDPQLILIPSTS
ncbi:hypothetical protein DUI87_25794 [Hirundo rustica rustica]|uniref:Uncharacterized protein n=1 Tax=Hirundo rustica rustica TaxID=333673 RepID=A0A3M0JAD2_HIRRU|nr:hypothetical protein DUI87_25794 [Hirundo rustica rustica]